MAKNETKEGHHYTKLSRKEKKARRLTAGAESRRRNISKSEQNTPRFIKNPISGPTTSGGLSRSTERKKPNIRPEELLKKIEQEADFTWCLEPMTIQPIHTEAKHQVQGETVQEPERAKKKSSKSSTKRTLSSAEDVKKDRRVVDKEGVIEDKEHKKKNKRKVYTS